MRVLAISHTDKGVAYIFGEGEYLGDKVPDTPPFNSLQLKNPCILLDSGKYVWGMECWWGELEKTKDKIKAFQTTQTVEPSNILPL